MGALTVGELLGLIKIDKTQFDRGVDDAERRLVKAGDNMDGSLSKLRGTLIRASRELLKGAGIAVFAAAAGGGVVNVLALVASLGSLVGLLAGAPALAVAFGGALAALKIGLTGVADAIGGDEEALAALAPQARAVVTEIRGLDGAWQQVRRTIQGRMFYPLQGEISALAGVWLPQLRDQLGAIAAQLGMFAREALLAAGDPGFRSGIGAALDWMRRLLTANSGAVYDVVRGLGALVGGIAAVLPASGGIAELAKGFADWATSAAESGQLADIWQTALGTLRQLGDIALQVGGILQAVLSAAGEAGGGTLGVLGDLLGTVNAFLSAGEGRAALLAIFTTLHQVVGALMPGLQVLAGALARALVPVLPLLVPLAGVVSRIAMALAPVIPLAGQLAGILAGLLTMALSNLLSAAEPVIAALVGALGPILPKIATALGQVLTAVAPLAAALGEFAAGALSQLLPPILELIPALIIGLVPAIEQLVGAALELLPTVSELVPLWAEMLVALTPLIAIITSLAVSILAALLPLVKFLNFSMQGAKFTVPLLTSVLRVLVGAIGTVAGWLGSLVGALGRALTAVMDFGGGALRWIGDLPGKIRGFFAGAAGWLEEAGKNILRGLLRGIEAMWGTVKGKLDQLTGLIPDWKGPAERDRKLLQPVGRLIVGGLITGMQGEFGRVRHLLRGWTDNMPQLAMAGTPALAGAGATSTTQNSVTYQTNIYPRQVSFGVEDLQAVEHARAVRARARRQN